MDTRNAGSSSTKYTKVSASSDISHVMSHICETSNNKISDYKKIYETTNENTLKRSKNTYVLSTLAWFCPTAIEFSFIYTRKLWINVYAAVWNKPTCIFKFGH